MTESLKRKKRWNIAIASAKEITYFVLRSMTSNICSNCYAILYESKRFYEVYIRFFFVLSQVLWIFDFFLNCLEHSILVKSVGFFLTNYVTYNYSLPRISESSQWLFSVVSCFANKFGIGVQASYIKFGVCQIYGELINII